MSYIPSFEPTPEPLAKVVRPRIPFYSLLAGLISCALPFIVGFISSGIYGLSASSEDPANDISTSIILLILQAATAIAAIVLGITALKKRRNNLGSRGMAIAGIVLGSVNIILLILEIIAIVAVLALVGAAATSLSHMNISG